MSEVEGENEGAKGLNSCSKSEVRKGKAVWAQKKPGIMRSPESWMIGHDLRGSQGRRFFFQEWGKIQRRSAMTVG